MKEEQRISRGFLPANLNSGLSGIHRSSESCVLCDIGQCHHAVIVWDQDYIHRGEVKQLSLKTEQRDKEHRTLSQFKQWQENLDLLTPSLKLFPFQIYRGNHVLSLPVFHVKKWLLLGEALWLHFYQRTDGCTSLVRNGGCPTTIMSALTIYQWVSHFLCCIWYSTPRERWMYTVFIHTLTVIYIYFPRLSAWHLHHPHFLQLEIKLTHMILQNRWVGPICFDVTVKTAVQRVKGEDFTHC